MTPEQAAKLDQLVADVAAIKAGMAGAEQLAEARRNIRRVGFEVGAKAIEGKAPPEYP